MLPILEKMYDEVSPLGNVLPKLAPALFACAIPRVQITVANLRVSLSAIGLTTRVKISK